MEQVLSLYFAGGIAPTTAGTYASAKRRFGEFCQQLGVSPVPAAQHTVALFISHLAQSGLRSTSIQTYMAAIRHMHIEAGCDTPAREHWHQVHYVLRGIRRSQSTTPRRTRLPITSDIMRAIQVAVFSPARECSELERHLLWAACCLGFFGFLRSGEFTVKDRRQETPLLFSDMAIDSHIQPSTIRLHIRKAKSDPFGNGIFIFLGRTGCQLCPVTAVLDYMARRPQGEGPLLIWGDRSPLRQDRFVQAVKAILGVAGIDPARYSGHSFRIGAASTAAARGIPDHLIKTLGRWRSEAYQLYVRTPPSTLAAVSSQLVVTRGQGNTPSQSTEQSLSGTFTP